MNTDERDDRRMTAARDALRALTTRDFPATGRRVDVREKWRAAIEDGGPLDYWEAEVLEQVRRLADRYPDDPAYASVPAMVEWCRMLNRFSVFPEQIRKQVDYAVVGHDPPPLARVRGNLEAWIARQ